MVYEIYSIGDGQFLERVLQGLAMMANHGTLTAVGAIGLTLGLISTSLRGVLTGGRDFPVMGSFVGLVLFMALFAPKVSVQIDDLNAVPGQKQLRTRVVDNVPFGAAAAGALISKIGVALTEVLETAFSTVDGARITDGGFGHTLDLLASGRQLIAGKLRRGEPYASFEQNLGSYLRDCTLTGLHRGSLRADDLLNRAPWVAIEYASAWASTHQVSTDGGNRDLTCDDAHRALGDSWPAAKASLLAEFDRGIGITRTAGGTYEDQLRATLANVAQEASLDASDYLVASAIAAQFDRAIAGSPLNSQAGANAILITQALAQRQTQWAAEENLFLKVMRPTMAFFEAVVFAVVPFMAFLIGLGSQGLALIGRYLLLTLWVQLWLPVLAIVNLYQCTQVEHYVAAMHLGSAAGGNVGLGDWIGLMNAAADWLATGSTLAAATPAITLSLLYGGAITATSLAGRLAGGDHVNEKIASPDLVAPAPMLSMASIKEWSPQTGITTTGGALNLPVLSMQEMSRHAESSAAQQLSSATLSAMQSLDRVVSSGKAAEVADAHAFANGFQHLSSGTEERLVQALMETGLSRQDSVSTLHQQQSKLLLNLRAALGATGRIGAGGERLGADAGLELGGGGAAESSDTGSRSHGEAFDRDFKDRFASNTNLRLAYGNAFAEAESAGTTGTATDRAGLQRNTRFARDMGRVEQSARQLAEVHERGAQFSMGQTINVIPLGQQIARDLPRFDHLVGVAQTFEPREFQRQRERLATSAGIDGRPGAPSERALDAAAAIVTLNAAVAAERSPHAATMQQVLIDTVGGQFVSDIGRADRSAEFADPNSSSAQLLHRSLESHVPRNGVGSDRTAEDVQRAYDTLHEGSDHAQTSLSRAQGHVDAVQAERQRQAESDNQRRMIEKRRQHDQQAAQAYSDDGSGESAGRLSTVISAARHAIGGLFQEKPKSDQ